MRRRGRDSKFLSPKLQTRGAGRETQKSSAGAHGPRNDLLPDLTIEHFAVSALKTAPRSLRKLTNKQLAAVTASVSEHGFVVPLLVTDDLQLVDGHTRLAAAKDLGLKELPCIRVSHLSQTQIRTLSLAINRTQETGVWDLDALASEMKELLDQGVELKCTGFEIPEIDFVIGNGSADPEPDNALNAIPAFDPEEPVVTRVGDLWQLGPHRVACGDALRSDAYDLALCGKQAAMMFTDPPYNVPIKGHAGGNGKIKHPDFVMASGEMSEAEFGKFLSTTLGLSSERLVSGAVSYVCMDWRHYATLRNVTDAIDLAPLNCCVWIKSNGGMGSFYRSQHEFIHVVRNPGGKHVNNVQLGRHGRNRTNVWQYAGVNGLDPARRGDLALHPTVKPVELVADAILDASGPGDLILDPFLGSGTTVIAAEKVQRACAGIELDPRYVDVVVRRWQQLSGSTAVLAATGASFNEVAKQRQPLIAPPPETGADDAEDHVPQQAQLELWEA